ARAPLAAQLPQQLLHVVPNLHQRFPRPRPRDQRRVALVARFETATAQRLLRAGDGEALFVEERADAPQMLDVAPRVDALTALRFRWANRAEFVLPVSEHVRLDADEVCDL